MVVVPGGESPALLRLMDHEPWFEALRRFHSGGGTLFGTCARAILLAREVREPAQPSVGLIDAVIRRNAFGRQIDSFETHLELDGSGPLPAVFIRAPVIERVGPQGEVLASLPSSDWGSPRIVAARQGRLLATAFHPELAGDDRFHQLFCGQVVR